MLKLFLQSTFNVFLIDDLSRLMSSYKEVDARSIEVLEEIELLSRDPKKFRKKLFDKLIELGVMGEDKNEFVEKMNKMIVYKSRGLLDMRKSSELEIEEYNLNDGPSTSSAVIRESFEETLEETQPKSSKTYKIITKHHQVKKALNFEDMSLPVNSNSSSPKKSKEVLTPPSEDASFDNLFLLVDEACKRRNQEEFPPASPAPSRRKTKAASTSKKKAKAAEGKKASKTVKRKSEVTKNKKIRATVSESEASKKEEPVVKRKKKTTKTKKVQDTDAISDSETECAKEKKPSVSNKKRKKPPKAKPKKCVTTDCEEEVDVAVDDADLPRYCSCDRPSSGDMVACDNESCPLEWFHFECVNIRKIPKDKW